MLSVEFQIDVEGDKTCSVSIPDSDYYSRIQGLTPEQAVAVQSLLRQAKAIGQRQAFGLIAAALRLEERKIGQ